MRGLGWDIDSSFSSNRGELFPIGSFGHTGFTGTSLWLDPGDEELRDLPVEPRAPGRQGRRDAAARQGRDRRGRGAAVAGDVGATRDVGAARDGAARSPALSRCAATGRASREPVLDRHRRARGRGLRAAARQARRAADEPDRPIARRREHDRSARAARRASRWSRCSAPSTASAAMLDDKVASSRDEKTGLPIHSLYGETRRPTDGDARRPRHASSSICRTSARASTPTPRRSAYVHGGSGDAEAAGRRARSAEPDRRLRHRGAGAGRRRQSASSATCRCRCATA